MKLLDLLIAQPLPDIESLVDKEVENYYAGLPREEEEEIDDSIIAEVMCTLSRDNNCTVSIHWSKELQHSKPIASMLYSLNEGEMKGLMAEIILRTATENVNHSESGKALLVEWENRYKDSEDKSVCPPSQVFGGQA